MVKVLFVCLGNICRSPMAEAIFRRHVAEAGLSDVIEVDSAGTGSWHAGESAHDGTLQELSRNGIDGSAMRARQVHEADLTGFDYVIAMDESNHSDLEDLGRGITTARLSLMLEHADEIVERSVPDPFFVGGFDHVYSLLDTSCRQLLETIRSEHSL